MIPKVIRVEPQNNHTVYVEFEDGKIVNYDVNPLLNKGVFKELTDIETFCKRCTVMNDTLAWDVFGNGDETKCIDIDPGTLYCIESAN